MPSPTPRNPTTLGTPAHWKHEHHTSQPTGRHPIADRQPTPTQVGLEQAIHRTTYWPPPIPPTMTLLSVRAFPLFFLAPELCQNETLNPRSPPLIRWNRPASALFQSPPLQANLRRQISRPAHLSVTAPPPPPSRAAKKAKGKPRRQKIGVTGIREVRKGEPTAPAGSSRSRLRL